MVLLTEALYIVVLIIFAANLAVLVTLCNDHIYLQVLKFLLCILVYDTIARPLIS